MRITSPKLVVGDQSLLVALILGVSFGFAVAVVAVAA